MYDAKSNRKTSPSVFDEEMHRSSARRLELELALRGAVDRNELHLVHQPILNIQTGELTGLESLLRWDHSKFGLVYPNDFIPLSEESGVIVPVGAWVLENACRNVREFRQLRDDPSNLSVSVNVSKRQLLDADFIGYLNDTLDRYQLSGEELNIEITESVVMDNPEQIADKLSQIKQLGIGIHMDDFGTGHSSLSCLHRFPIDVLKIDQSFVSTMDSNPEYEAIVFAIISLAHNLNVKVIAEGIETEQQLQQLRDLGCDYGQGYFFAKPKPTSEIASVLAEMSLNC